MAAQSKTVHKKRGRPAGIKFGETVPARFEPRTLKALDAWAKKNDVSRSEAIRQLIEKGLTVPAARKPKRGDAAARAGRDTDAERAAHDYIDNALKHEPEHVRTARKKRLTTMPAGAKRHAT